MPRLTEKQKRELYWMGGVSSPKAEGNPLRPKRKILIDLWVELAERGKVQPWPEAVSRYVSAFEKRETSVSIALEETLDAAIKALRRKLTKPAFRGARR